MKGGCWTTTDGRRLKNPPLVTLVGVEFSSGGEESPRPPESSRVPFWTRLTACMRSRSPTRCRLCSRTSGTSCCRRSSPARSPIGAMSGLRKCRTTLKLEWNGRAFSCSASMFHQCVASRSSQARPQIETAMPVIALNPNAARRRSNRASPSSVISKFESYQAACSSLWDRVRMTGSWLKWSMAAAILEFLVGCDANVAQHRASIAYRLAITCGHPDRQRSPRQTDFAVSPRFFESQTTNDDRYCAS